jgi:hypothetical protein
VTIAVVRSSNSAKLQFREFRSSEHSAVPRFTPVYMLQRNLEPVIYYVRLYLSLTMSLECLQQIFKQLRNMDWKD